MEKLRLDMQISDPRVRASWDRTQSLARQHKPFLAFVFFASFIILCMRLPWAGTGDYNGSNSGSSLATDEANRGGLPPANATLGIGNGTEVYLPPESVTRRPKFAKVAVASGFEDILYEKALATHWEHAVQHGYPMYLARENAADGMFNKVAYIMSVLLNELYKPAEERVEWLFYFDADSIIMNPLIPLEIFIPPSDFQHIHWLAGKDYNGLNAGVFIIRVNSWSLDLLTRTMTYKHYHPNEDYTFEEQTILARLTEKDEEFKANSIYVPKGWFNAYFSSLHEVKPGLLLSHFPHPDYKWHIYEWLRVLEADKDPDYKPVYSLPVEETDYPAEIKQFWQVRRRTEKALKGFDRNINRGADPVKFGMEHEETRKLAEDFREKLEQLREGNTWRIDNPAELDNMVTEAEEANAKLISELMAYFETHDNPPNVAGF